MLAEQTMEAEKQNMQVDMAFHKDKLTQSKIEAANYHHELEDTKSKLAKALQVELPEVETWVLRAIGSGLITAKMDQVQQVVAISNCAERDFGQKQWERLHGSLTEWRDSIRSLLQVLQNSRPGK